MKDVRFYYGFYVEVFPSIPFEGLYEDLQEKIVYLVLSKKIKKACICEEGEKVNIVVVGGTPRIWHDLNANVHELDSTVADRLIDMFGNMNRSYIFEEDVNKNKKGEKKNDCYYRCYY